MTTLLQSRPLSQHEQYFLTFGGDWWRTCWARIQSTASTSEYTFALMAVGIENQDWPHMQQRNMCTDFSLSAHLVLLPFQRHVEILASGRDKMGPATNELRGKGNNCSKASIGPTSKDYGEQIPVSLSQQTMLYPNRPDVSIMLEIKSRKNENRKSMPYLSDIASILGGTQCPNRLHCRDPHGTEGGIECLFDLQCHQLAKIMGHL